MHGFAPGTFNGTHEEWLSSIHPHDREPATKAVAVALQKRSDYEIEYRTIRADGSVNWIVGRAALECDADCNQVRAIGMCMDITHRKLTEEALRKTEKLAAGRLAATIAHESTILWKRSPT